MTPVYAPVTNGLLGRTLRGSLGLQIRTAMRLRGMRRPLIWVTCPTAAVVLDSLPAAGVVHQLSDCYGALNASWSDAAVRMEGEVARSADVIICASGRLLSWAIERYGQGEYVDHGVDFERFDAAARARETPAELQNVRRPVIGFFGNMDDNTVDRALLEAVARLRPDYTFALVGPMASNFESLKALPNVAAVPQQPYERIAHYGAAFDVCLMPWLQNDWIAHCNPVKLKEYLALGKPVVSTPFPELEHFADVCYTAVGSDEFARAVDRALAEDGDERRAARRNRAAAHTWDMKFQHVLNLLGAKGIIGHA
jgi:glycosyltransferase involved in cell wall biosynthesis